MIHKLLWLSRRFLLACLALGVFGWICLVAVVAYLILR